MSLPKLTYLHGKGKGEAIRLTLHIGNVAFEDERISYEELATRREAGLLPFGQLPTLDIGDGTVYAQSQAILRWAGKQAGLYPEHLQLKCDMVIEALNDIDSQIVPAWYHSAMKRHPVTSEPMVPLSDGQAAEVVQLLNDVVLPARLAPVERLLAEGAGPYFCGAEMTTCDVVCYAILQDIAAGKLSKGGGVKAEGGGPGIQPAVLDNCPALRALLQLVARHPRVEDWEFNH